MSKIASTIRYSLDELERGWLVNESAVGDLTNVPFRQYEDLYIPETRLRLRRII